MMFATAMASRRSATAPFPDVNRPSAKSFGWLRFLKLRNRLRLSDTVSRQFSLPHVSTI
jgi:hypothetical protein